MKLKIVIGPGNAFKNTAVINAETGERLNGVEAVMVDVGLNPYRKTAVIHPIDFEMELVGEFLTEEK